MSADARPIDPVADRFEPDLMRRKLTGTIFYGLCLGAIGILLLTLLLLLYDVLSQGLPWLDADFLTGVPSRRPEKAGILPALVGSIMLAIIVGMLRSRSASRPRSTWRNTPATAESTRMLQTNISTWPACPRSSTASSGLAIFVRALSLGLTIISGALTITLLILPIVIIASIEAIKAVPDAQREGAYALGASRWQMVRRSVLPAAAPGIMTGIILAMARAIGESAPLILVGAFTFVTFIPQPFVGGYTVLPIQIFDWATRPQDDFHGIASATIIVVLVLMFLLNGLALIVRARLSRHIQW